MTVMLALLVVFIQISVSELGSAYDHNCRVAIYDGESCASPGTAHYDVSMLAENPWSATDNANMYTMYTNEGTTNITFTFKNRYDIGDYVGKVFVLYNTTSTDMIGCGALETMSTTNYLTAQMSRYLEYTGKLEVSGMIYIVFHCDNTFKMSFDLKGLGKKYC